MSTPPAEFRARLESLVNKFKANANEYLAASYAEAMARHQFIDPLFAALGWDFEDKASLGPSSCEVWTEKGDTPGKPDYTFRINGKTQFFAEAKAPHVKLGAKEILQAKRYAWNHASVSIAALTDFEEFRVYDGSLKPDEQHPDLGLIFAHRYDQYLTEAALADLWKLSRDEVAAGSLDSLRKQDAATKSKRVPVDKAFLADLTDWREQLAKDAFKNDPALSVSALNEAVQVLLDRLIFIRIAEDRRIVEADTLKRLADKWSEGKHRSLRAMLDELFATINEDLNGEVFKPNAALDAAAFDDALTAKIIRALCDGPYDFAIIGVELLGSIYERYLGKTIRVTAKRAVVEDKPEVRKAGGVYYTPRYIVDYIVEQTVGKLIEGKTPAQIAKLRVLDPACGSGSFLLAAYQKLIDYHVAYYSAHPKEARQGELFPYLIVEPDGLPGGKRLSIEKKGEILTNNIYGVDIDPQAIEVTMMSLYIKALEGETTLPHKQGLLPSLKNNIQCGNSLIGTDYKEKNATELEHIRPFNWEEQFPQIFQTLEVLKTSRVSKSATGFDCVIGNPPWGAELSETERSYLVNRYPLIPTKTKDSYFYFIARSIELLRHAGILGFIVPNTWLLINNAQDFRRELLSFDVKEIIDHGDGIFKEATVESVTLLLVNKKAKGSCRAVRVRKGQVVTDHLVDKGLWIEDEFCRIIVDINPMMRSVLDKLRSTTDPFEKSCTITWGIKPYQVGYGAPPQTREMVDKRVYHAETKKGRDWKPLLVGSDVNRYRMSFPGDQFIKYGKWLMYPSNEELMLQPKILMRQTSDIIRACYDDESYYCQNSVFIVHSHNINLKFLLGLLNSRLVGFVYKMGNPQTGKVFAEIKPSVVKQLPICRINFSDSADVARHDRMVSLVERMMELHQRLAQAHTSADRDLYQRQIESTDRQIDALVYELYGLTKSEIAVVEG